MFFVYFCWAFFGDPTFLIARLVAVREATHSGHNAENVVVRGIDTDRGARRGANSVVGDREEEGRVITAGQVARA